jgi:hypothetical protein
LEIINRTCGKYGVGNKCKVLGDEGYLAGRSLGKDERDTKVTSSDSRVDWIGVEAAHSVQWQALLLIVIELRSSYQQMS